MTRRRLARGAAKTGDLAWPDARRVRQRARGRVDPATGQLSEETTDGVTSPPLAAASPVQIEALWRGHWTIENKVHHVRDATLGEDA